VGEGREGAHGGSGGRGEGRVSTVKGRRVMLRDNGTGKKVVDIPAVMSYQIKGPQLLHIKPITEQHT
jgi:hypothetical protein